MPTRLLTALLVLLAAFALSSVAANDGTTTTPPPIDWARARDLHQRDTKGEKLSADDKAYLDRARAERQKGNGGGNGGNRPAAPPPRESTGLVPLSDKSGPDYKGFKLGLYGDNKNDPPADHLRRATDAAAKIVPLDAAGQPAADGKIGLMSIGMSNTTQEFSRFVQLASEDPAKNPKLVLVDAAQGGQASLQWIDERGSKRVWDTAEDRLRKAGVTDAQVQVVWIKQARIGPAALGEFPQHAKVLQENVRDIITLAKARFPNLKLVYLSSRTYAGLAKSGLNPEPYAYESAFSVQWLIQSQINCTEKDLAYAKAPVLLWGPYLWTDGTKGRTQDQLTWTKEDTAADGTHPSNISGRQKVGEKLLSFFKSDPTATTWFAR